MNEISDARAAGDGAGDAPAYRVDAAISNAAATIAEFSDDPRLEAELLLGNILGASRAQLYTHPERLLDATQTRRFAALIARRARGEPLAYLLGEQPFGELLLRVTADTLIPRADTLVLVAAALASAPAHLPVRVLDLGTGSGAVALAIAHAREHWRITASDSSAPALAVARDNAEHLGLGARVTLCQSDWFDGLANTAAFDLVVANPPYIAEDDPHLSDPGLAAEPRQALVSGADGLDAIRRIAAGAPARLAPGGWLWLEHGWQQGAAVRDLLGQLGYHRIRTLQDAGARERVTGGQPCQ